MEPNKDTKQFETKDAAGSGPDKKDETSIPDVVSANIPFAIHDRHDHGSIVDLVKHAVVRRQVIRCLAAGPAGFDELSEVFAKFSTAQVGSNKKKNWQQILFRLRDERGNSVDDYHLEFNVWRRSKLRETYPGRRGSRRGVCRPCRACARTPRSSRIPAPPGASRRRSDARAPCLRHPRT